MAKKKKYYAVVKGRNPGIYTEWYGKNGAAAQVTRFSGALYQGLSALKKPSSVFLYSDSKYVVDGISKGWAKRWQSNGWTRTKKEPAINPDLWEQLLELCGKHDVRFQWVKGHDGNEGNERCDELASKEASSKILEVDEVYENLNGYK